MKSAKSILGILLATLTVIAVGCLQTENSSSQDEDLYGTVGGTAEFLAARSVIAQNCAGCHLYHSLDEDEMVTAGLIIKGDPEGSKLYYRLAGSSGTGGPKDMPTGSTLSIGNLAIINAWIQNAQ